MFNTLPTLEIHPASARGHADFGWLSSYHTFSFGHYHNPEQVGFSDLLVINDDRVQAGQGFGTHPHRDMEIFSYILSGTLAHQDSMGNGSNIHTGDVQMMSAGTGVRHSEFNPSLTETVHFLQIWVVPQIRGIKPRYQQKHFNAAQKRGQLCPIVKQNQPDCLDINQNFALYAGLLDGDEQTTYIIPENRYTYLHIARGTVQVNGQPLSAGDGVRIRESGRLNFSQGKDAEVLVFDLRPHEQPRP